MTNVRNSSLTHQAKKALVSLVADFSIHDTGCTGFHGYPVACIPPKCELKDTLKGPGRFLSTWRLCSSKLAKGALQGNKKVNWWICSHATGSFSAETTKTQEGPSWYTTVPQFQKEPDPSGNSHIDFDHIRKGSGAPGARPYCDAARCVPLPRINGSMDALSSNKYFTTLDLTGSYWQVPLDVDGQKKSAFTIRSGF